MRNIKGKYNTDLYRLFGDKRCYFGDHVFYTDFYALFRALSDTKARAGYYNKDYKKQKNRSESGNVGACKQI